MPIKEPPNAYGISLVCEPWYALEDFSNAKSHLTSPSPRPVHLALSNWRDHLLQVHGALSLDVHLLPIIKPPLHDDEELEATPKDERWDLLWQVRANVLSAIR